MVATRQAVGTITPERLKTLLQGGAAVELLDVRTPVEFRELHVVGARNVPLDRLDAAAIAAGRNGNQEPLYLLCRSGGRAKQACEKIIAAGYPSVVCVTGGTLACAAADLPVVRGKKAVSLERQVRIISGVMGILGVSGAFYSPWFLALPAMVGVGMLHSGITDSCLMGMMLGRMPWNQVEPERAADGPSCRC